MSYENRAEDVEKILNMEVGDELEFNMFQEGGSEVKRVSPYTWELSEITTYGISVQFWYNYTAGELKQLVDDIYEKFT
ncbi:conserved hypothetical protein [Vibrio phage 277E43-1]|nr:conserved hypothetical protein [Vibrio phage 277E43-1]